MTPDDAVPGASDLRRVVDEILGLVASLPDDAWDRPACGLEWDCRDTVAHLMDDFGSYAMQLSGTSPPLSDYIALLDPPVWREGSPQILFWPDPAMGTAGIVSCLDATAGLLCAVVATAPAERRGFHPRGTSDASGFAAMGIVEASLHALDILQAQSIDFRAGSQACRRSLNRLFPAAARTDDPWQDLLVAGGRTPQTRDRPWTWDSTVRPSYGVGAATA